ncbi:hypothetical protein RRG08_003747 [Elysia crispata]|uniref:Uncharacterized protein n=1 Tax=Elysia crispata TaxID=231223 RepID=A0AAE1AVT9_9GAST|nr:hypothetical protein RRG08_003747 [Elysia crispata]
MRNLSWCCVSEIWRRNVETVLQQLETGLELLIKNTALLMISENENSIYVRPCLVVKTLEAQSKKKSSHLFDHSRVDMTRLKSVKIFKPEIAHFFIHLFVAVKLSCSLFLRESVLELEAGSIFCRVSGSRDLKPRPDVAFIRSSQYLCG